jgi:hypothetical protein
LSPAYTLSKPYPNPCPLYVLSWLLKGELNPHGVQSQFWFHFFQRRLLKTAPVIAPRVTFLRERFWANGFELDQTVENPEPFLAPLPSSRAVSSEIELLQRSSSCFTGQFSVAGTCVLGLCAFARMLMTSPDLDLRTSLTRSTLSSLVPLSLYQTLDQSKDSSSSLSANCKTTGSVLLMERQPLPLLARNYLDQIESFSYCPGMYFNIDF